MITDAIFMIESVKEIEMAYGILGKKGSSWGKHFCLQYFSKKKSEMSKIASASKPAVHPHSYCRWADH